VADRPPHGRYFNAAHLSIVCPEETLHVRPEEIEPMHRKTFMPAERAHEYLRGCQDWGVPLLPTTTLEPVISDVPTLCITQIGPPPFVLEP
jgi:hypothetical protein